MDWYIRDIVVYGEGGETRTVSVGPGVNIITGMSRTGKSALVPIVDYCLGSGEYEVPVGVIREFARWYGIRLQTPQEQLFIARKEPGRQRSTATMHLIVGREVPVPALVELTGNSDRDTVVAELSRRLGLMEQSLAETRYDTALTEPPTARNVAPFLFQSQNVIANKDVLFYKTDQTRHRDHRQRLQRIFPYVLGAIDAAYFARKGQLDTAQRELRQLEHRLAEEESLVGGGTSAARALWDRAVALGLAGADPEADAAGGDTELDLAVLRGRLVALTASAGAQPARSPAVAGNPERAAALDVRSRELRSELAGLRQRLETATNLAQEADAYGGALQAQRGRLRAVELVPAAVDGAVTCPVCAQLVEHIVPQVGRLRQAHDEVRARLEGLTAARPALTEHTERVRGEIAARRAELTSVESQLAALYRAQDDAESADAAWAEQQRHLGAMQFYLERTPAESRDPGALARRVEQLRHRVARLQEELDDFDAGARLDSALSVVGQTMSTLSRSLGLEQSDSPLRLDIKALTVLRDSPTGRPERLYEIGSGENWVGFHLCALFALHTFFLRRGSPVPSFLFLDQPSQIYFPEEVGGAQTGASPGGAQRQTDWAAVQRMYRMIFDTVRNLDNRLQVIILDHADLSDPPEFPAAIRARWRDGRALI